MYNLFLDDERPLSFLSSYFNEEIDNFIIAKNYNEFCNSITEKGLPCSIWFDHDLGQEKSGYDCAKWLVQYCIDNKK